MNVVLGERYVTGVAVEATRGTFAAAQDYARGRTPATIQTVVDKVDIQETEGSGLATKGQVTTMKRVQGEAPVNLRFRTYGYWLKSLLGGCSSALEAGETAVYRHSFTVDPSALQPSLSLSLTRGEFDHKAINGAVVSQITENYALDDVVNATIGLMGRTETTVSDFTPAFSDDDYLAPHQSVTIKIADDVAGLGAAPSICVTSITNEMNRNTREKGCLSSENAQDFIARLLNLSGSFVWDKTADTYKALAEDNTEKAMQISIINTGVDIGVASNPSLIYTFPRVNLSVNEERPVDDAVTETVSWIAHGITASLVNEKANYNAAA